MPTHRPSGSSRSAQSSHPATKEVADTARAAAPKKTFAPDILTLWQKWQDLDTKPPLDRWLKQQGQEQKRQPLFVRLAVHQALLHAARFVQLACVLERLQHKELDLEAWDSAWQDTDTHRVDNYAFWYWLELRTGQYWGFAELVNQPTERHAHYKACQAKVKAEPLSALSLLWHGLRPMWLPVLNLRAQASQWSNEQLATFVRQQATQPPLWLRINALKNMPADEALTQLNEDGVRAFLLAEGLCVNGGSGLQQHPLYTSGVVEVQDLASQQVVAAMNIQKGEKIWDVCAGAGGKSLAMAATLQNKGAVVATDLYAYKLDELKKRAKRAGALNIRTFTWEGNEPLRLPQEIARQGGFDQVLVDAPCSASGTWRRNPDARWRFQAAQPKLLELQQRLLALAAHSVRAQGLLVYATCSFDPAENEQQVAAFLATHPEFTLCEQRLLGAPWQDSDTLFVARLKRNS